MHASYLGQGRVGFVDQEYEIFRKEIHQRARSRSLGPPGNMSGVILNARAEPEFLQLLQIKLAPHFNALGLEQFPLLFELSDTQTQFFPNGENGRINFLLRCRELLARENVDGVQRFQSVAR